MNRPLGEKLEHLGLIAVHQEIDHDRLFFRREPVVKLGNSGLCAYV
jgi:hypothetical protein